MADIQIIGHIEGIHYGDNHVAVTITENILGYKRSDGRTVEDSVATWRVIFKHYFKKYVAAHFANGAYVKVKGYVLPYVKEKNEYVEGCSVIGQTLDLAPYPKANVRQARKITKTSSNDEMGTPDIDGYNELDF